MLVVKGKGIMQKKLKFVLMWHMHQPHYRDGLDGTYRLPWVYLHAIKDYTDMVSHLENIPRAKVVVNFAAVLLEQLKDYEEQFTAYFESGQPFRDELLNWLAGVHMIPKDLKTREQILSDCLRLNRSRLLEPYPAFKKLIDEILDLNSLMKKQRLNYFNKQWFLDVLTWYHLVWTGESLRRADPKISKLMSKGSNFNQKDRNKLLKIYQTAISGLIERYKNLMEKGQIEISMTPYGHPIVPLLIDFDAMSCSQPHDPRPGYAEYPGGEERVDYHFDLGLEVYQKYLGHSPKGIWLSEGAVSEAALTKLDEYGYHWTATGQQVWNNSCVKSGCFLDEQSAHPRLFKGYQVNQTKVKIFFRDDGLSDLIGFKYQNWFAPDAVGDFIHHLENIYHSFADKDYDPIVSVILDGENAWEYYPDNGYHFLSQLYQALTQHPYIQMTTYSEVIAHEKNPYYQLSHFCPGSWVYGTFSTWIGSRDKNTGWDRLIEAKLAYDKAIGDLSEEEAKLAAMQLAVCEGSDWFWWFGDYNPAGPVKDFDALYRRHLAKLYQMLKLPVPDNLHVSLSQGNENTQGHSGTMRANS